MFNQKIFPFTGNTRILILNNTGLSLRIYKKIFNGVLFGINLEYLMIVCEDLR